jgi:hypothetical protein
MLSPEDWNTALMTPEDAELLDDLTSMTSPCGAQEFCLVRTDELLSVMSDLVGLRPVAVMESFSAASGQHGPPPLRSGARSFT